MRGNRKKYLNRPSFPMIKCLVCGYKNPDDRQFCQRDEPTICRENLHPDNQFDVFVPKNSEQARKMSFLLSEKKWHADIKSRRKMPDGTIARMSDQQWNHVKQRI